VKQKIALQQASHLGLVALLCLLFAAKQNLHAQSFKAYGNYYHTNYDGAGAPSGELTGTFSANVENEKIHLRLDFIPDQHHYAEWTYDGKTAYSVLDNITPTTIDQGARAAAMVTEDEFPTPEFCIARTIWLGLCSAHYFSNPTNSPTSKPTLVPWLDWSTSGMLSFQWRMKNFQETPFLPSNIVFTASTDLWAKEAKMRINLEDSFPFRDGFIGGEFEVKQTQSFKGMTLPSSFILKRYRFGGPKGQLLEFYDIQVTSLTASTPENFIPKIQRPTDVSDMRDGTADMPRFGITYTLTDDNWLAKSDPKRLAMVEAHKPVYWSWRHSLERKSAYRRIAMIFAGVVFLSFVVWLFRKS